MSHHSDEQHLVVVGSDSFWEPGNYKRTTRRVDDGHRLCADLAQLVAERAEIEKAYAKSLKGWAKKWNDLIEKGPEYGTTEAAWKGVLVEAERLCDLHLKVRDRLVEDVIQQIKNWQKDNYHKSMIHIKERKEMDEAFKKAQKPWVKRLQKVERAKADYHNACKQERTAHNQERNATGDTSLSPDQKAIMVKKMGERVSRSKEEVSKSREKYQVALAEINAFNPRYVEDMGGVFDRCQAMEAHRLLFFKDVLYGVHKSINISQDPVLPQIYEEFYHTISNADHHKDLKWWSNNHGVNMPMAWPQFEPPPEECDKIVPLIDSRLGPVLAVMGLSQALSTATAGLNATANRYDRFKFAITDKIDAVRESSLCSCMRRDGALSARTIKVAPSAFARTYDTYHFNDFQEYTEEFRDIAKGKSKESIPAGPITLINQRPVGEDAVELPPPNSNNKPVNSQPVGVVPTRNITTVSTVSSTTNSIEKKPPTQNGTGGSAPAPGSATNSGGGNSPSSTGGNAAGKDNPFEEEEWDEEDGGTPLVDNGEPGVPVRALYDYTGAESDELTFRQGDMFEKLEDEDEQGWCKGRKDGRVGLYPANYVEPTGH